ncbi:MAG: ATP-binding protein [Deltaproteobacteria bacterium]|jgi:hypothetical protein|nr:ATP-binding protein [Deltaproteobacteria bacterium]
MDEAKSLKRKLPTGIQSFAKLMEDGLVYADKTRMIYELARTRKPYFLARPRRFGKSLLLSAFEALFAGQDPDGPPQGIFKDLWIGGSDWDFSKKYPVVYLNMNEGYESREMLKATLEDTLSTVALREGLDISAPAPGRMLAKLIERLSLKYKARTVLLIDEYDAPVSENLHDIGLMTENSEELKIFYSSLKNCDKHLRFVMVTGVTRYAMIGLSAGLNNLTDITFDDGYSGICGFTLEEFDACFKDFLPVSLEQMKIKGFMKEQSTVADLRQNIFKWYDGYSWDGKTRVLNPWSILRFFETSRLSAFWGNNFPSVNFLSKLVKGEPFALLERKIGGVPLNVLERSHTGSLTPVAGRFQTGYLTIEKITANEDMDLVCALKTPNMEIEKINSEAFSGILFDLLARKPQEVQDDLEYAVRIRDAAKITEIFSSLYAGLPARHHPRLGKSMEENESFYHSVMYAYCVKLGRLTLAEHPEAVGIPDLILLFQRDSLEAVIELKFGRSEGGDPDKLLTGLARDALAAVNRKDYGSSLRTGAKQTVKIGVGVTARGKCLALIDDAA